MDRNRNALPVWAKVATSLSARRAWIEIAHSLNHKVCVRVALRKESVDRNVAIAAAHFYGKVALRKESVDRNIVTRGLLQQLIESLSARRAWIEIYPHCPERQ